MWESAVFWNNTEMVLAAWVPLAYFSRKLEPRETRYTITELETMAIVDSVEHFAVYLLGVPLESAMPPE